MLVGGCWVLVMVLVDCFFDNVNGSVFHTFEGFTYIKSHYS